MAAKDLGKDEIETLRSDFTKLRQSVLDLAEAVQDNVRSDASDYVDRLRELGGSVGAEADRVGRNVRRRGRRGLDAVGDQVEERPFTTLLVAFGLGLLVGRLVGR